MYNKREGIPNCILIIYETFELVAPKREETIQKYEVGYYIFNSYPEKFLFWENFMI